MCYRIYTFTDMYTLAYFTQPLVQSLADTSNVFSFLDFSNMHHIKERVRDLKNALHSTHLHEAHEIVYNATWTNCGNVAPAGFPCVPDRYDHWGVVERLGRFKYHKYYCGTRENNVVFFGHARKDFVELCEFTGYKLVTDCSASIKKTEFVMRQPKSDKNKERVSVFRCASESEAQFWSSLFVNTANFKQDKAEAERRREQETRNAKRKRKHAQMQALLREQQTQPLRRSDSSTDPFVWNGTDWVLREAFDWDGRLQEVLQEATKWVHIDCTRNDGLNFQVPPPPPTHQPPPPPPTLAFSPYPST